MDLYLKGKTAVVTGASQGMGRAIAKELAMEGVRVLATARSEKLLDTLREEIIEAGGERAGFLMLAEEPTTLQIHTLCVAREYQGLGIGSRVTMDVVQCGDRLRRAVILSVLKVNVRAATLYKRLGFVFVDESEHHYHMRYGAPKRSTLH